MKLLLSAVVGGPIFTAVGLMNCSTFVWHDPVSLSSLYLLTPYQPSPNSILSLLSLVNFVCLCISIFVHHTLMSFDISGYIDTLVGYIISHL
jgi:hypothetical protein